MHLCDLGISPVQLLFHGFSGGDRVTTLAKRTVHLYRTNRLKLPSNPCAICRQEAHNNNKIIIIITYIIIILPNNSGTSRLYGLCK